MPTVRTRKSQQIYYEIIELADPWARAETVFLHHGLGKSAKWWRPWIRLLCEQFNVVVIDMLGCGRSGQPEGYPWSVADHADNAADVIDALGLDRVHFVGETLGGCVGLVMGARYPDRVHSLALMACPFRPPSTWLLQQSAEIAEHGIEPTLDRDLDTRLDWARYPPGMREWYREQRLNCSPRVVAEQYAAQAKENLEWTLDRITAPTLLFVPDASPVDANLQMVEMGRRIASAQLAQLAKRRRQVWDHYAEAPEYVAALTEFITLIPAGR